MHLSAEDRGILKRRIRVNPMASMSAPLFWRTFFCPCIFTGSSETHSRNAFAMSCCNASQAGVVMRHRLVTEIVVNLMLFKVDVLIHIPVPRLQDGRSWQVLQLSYQAGSLCHLYVFYCFFFFGSSPSSLTLYPVTETPCSWTRNFM